MNTRTKSSPLDTNTAPSWSPWCNGFIPLNRDPTLPICLALLLLASAASVCAEGVDDYKHSETASPASNQARTGEHLSDSIRTWEHAFIAVPPEFTVTDLPCIGFLGEDAGRECLRQAQAAAREVAEGLPVVIYSHGCGGLATTARPEEAFIKAGYVFVAMNHLLHLGDEGSSCGRARYALWGHLRNRFSDIRYTARKLKEVLPVNQERFFLAGFSMGGAAVQMLKETLFAGRISLGTSCQLGWGALAWLSGIKGDPNTPVLSIHGGKDPFVSREREYPGDCAPYIKERPLSASVVVPHADHAVLAYQEAHDAIKDFLSRVSAAGKGRAGFP